jgi:hypothetical protein
MTWIGIGDVAGVFIGANVRSALGRREPLCVAGLLQYERHTPPCRRNDSREGTKCVPRQLTWDPAEAGGITP